MINTVEDYTQQFISFLDQKSDEFSAYAIPKIKEVYPRIFESYVKKYFPEFQNNPYDPAPISFYLDYSKRIEQITEYVISLKLPEKFDFLSKSLLGAAQMLHSFIKESNYFMELPIKLDAYAKDYNDTRLLTIFTRLLGTRFNWINTAILSVRYLVLKNLELTLGMLEYVLQTITFNYEIPYLTFWKEWVRSITSFFHEKIYLMVHKLIEKNTAKLRKQAVIYAGNEALQWVVTKANRTTVKGGIGIGAYLFALYAIQKSTPIPSWAVHIVALPIIANMLWKYSWKETLEPYVEAYNHGYNPNKEMDLKELCKKWGIEKFRLQLGLINRLIVPLCPG